MSLPYNNKLIPYAKQLRKNATPWERKIWFYFLKDYPVRFQRQKVIDNFIVDFYCHKARLIIELDGSGHFFEEQIDYDNKRTCFFEKNNLKVLRFTNLEVDKKFYGVCTVIDNEVKKRIINK